MRKENDRAREQEIHQYEAVDVAKFFMWSEMLHILSLSSDHCAMVSPLSLRNRAQDVQFLDPSGKAPHNFSKDQQVPLLG